MEVVGHRVKLVRTPVSGDDWCNAGNYSGWFVAPWLQHVPYPEARFLGDSGGRKTGAGRHGSSALAGWTQSRR